MGGSSWEGNKRDMNEGMQEKQLNLMNTIKPNSEGASHSLDVWRGELSENKVAIQRLQLSAQCYKRGNLLIFLPSSNFPFW